MAQFVSKWSFFFLFLFFLKSFLSYRDIFGICSFGSICFVEMIFQISPWSLLMVVKNFPLTLIIQLSTQKDYYKKQHQMYVYDVGHHFRLFIMRICLVNIEKVTHVLVVQYLHKGFSSLFQMYMGMELLSQLAELFLVRIILLFLFKLELIQLNILHGLELFHLQSVTLVQGVTKCSLTMEQGNTMLSPYTMVSVLPVCVGRSIHTGPAYRNTGGKVNIVLKLWICFERDAYKIRVVCPILKHKTWLDSTHARKVILGSGAVG